MRRVAVIGSTGQLGTDVVQVLTEAGAYQVYPLSHREIECTDLVSVRQALTAVGPGVVINCAAFVRVDECETRPEEAFRVNAIGALVVARACAGLDALCVYISTDYVFDGEKGEPYTEHDPPCPINVYGTSKLAGEYLVQQACPRWLIVRVASLFGKAGARGKGGNFVETVLRKAWAGEPLKVVDDIRMSPTYTVDAARALEWLIRQGATGLFHLANAGACSWYEFAHKALDLANPNARLERLSTAAYPSQARRPKNSSLRSSRIRSPENRVRSWDEALGDYLRAKGHLPS
jgi:dTDP-4-dehydrorhamnose reductase